MKELTDGWMGVWVEEMMDGWKNEMDGWSDGWRDGWIDERTDRWMDGCSGR